MGTIRVVIENIQPQLDSGSTPVRRVAGEEVSVEARIFTDGHDQIDGALLFRAEDSDQWQSVPLKALGNDLWRAAFTVQRLGRYEYTVCAWVDHARTWQCDFKKKYEAAQETEVDLLVGAEHAHALALRATEGDARRLSETVKRATRAGVRNLQVRSPIRPDALDGLEARMDLVFVDAPCTGSGTWRRHPDAKWRLTPAQLERRTAEQDAVLAAASIYVKPGGRLIYVTCSLLAEENEDRVAAFLTAHPAFAVTPVAVAGTERWLTAEGFLRLTPHTAGTDGFFVAALTRGAA